MAARALQIDDDDLIDILRGIEISFGIAFRHELRHIVTAGDLCDAVLAATGPERGWFCPTQRVFHVIRRTLVPFGLSPQARPDFPLKQLTFSSPRSARRLLQRETGLVIPAPPLSMLGCLILAMALIGTAAAWMTGHLWAIPAAVLAAIVCVKSDRGRWAGNWTSLGELTRTVAAGNHNALVNAGARHSKTTVWHALTAILADHGADREAISRESLLTA